MGCDKDHFGGHVPDSPESPARSFLLGNVGKQNALPAFFLPILRTGTELARSVLARHAAYMGHESFEAFLRALRPSRVTRDCLDTIITSLPALNEEEQRAAADLFYAFCPEQLSPREDQALFHKTLLDPQPLNYMYEPLRGYPVLPDTLLPCYLSNYWSFVSR
jgi:hypothetical protein